MSKIENTQVRADEPELSDEALEQVAGGCHVDSHLLDPPLTGKPTSPYLLVG